VKISEIKYICIYKEFNKSDIEDVFKYNILKKNTYLYHAIYNDNLNTINVYVPNFFTLTPFSRVFDPLYLNKDKYLISEYVIRKDIKTLDLTTNIYFDNQTLIKCFDIYSIKNNNKFCNYGFKDIDHNRRNSLYLIIYKSEGIIDKSISYKLFLKSIYIHSFFNIMKLVKTINNDNKLLYEELYIDNTHKNDIIKNIEYTDDLTKFNINDIKEYEILYFLSN